MTRVSINYEREILDQLMKNPSGLTITDLTTNLAHSRNTISKYVSTLEIKGEIFSKKIGAYALYFSSKRDFFPKKLIIDYYKALLYNLKEYFPKKEQMFKEIGKNLDKIFHLKLDYLPLVKENLPSLEKVPPKVILKTIGEFYPQFDVFQESLILSDMNIDDSETRATFRFRNSDFIKEGESFNYHFYLVCGLMESILKRELKREVKCDIEKINLFNKKEESYVDISIEIKE